VKKALDTSHWVAVQGEPIGFGNLQRVYFQHVPHVFMFIPGLENLRTIPREADKSGGFRLSTSVENPVDNSNAALEAV